MALTAEDVNTLISQHPLLVQLEQRIMIANRQIIDEAKVEMASMNEQMRVIMKKADENFTSTTTNLAQHSADSAAAEQKLAAISTGIQEIVDVFNVRDATLREWVTTQSGILMGQINSGQQAVGSLISNSQTEFANLQQRITADMHGYVAANVGQGSSSSGGGGGPKSILDSRDFKVEKLEVSPSLESFKKWRHDLCLFLQTHAKWSGAGLYLDKARRWTREIEAAEHDQIILDLGVDRVTKMPIVNRIDWDFNKHGAELYQLLCSRVNLDLFTRFSQEGSTNGFEMWRQVNRDRDDPAKKDAGFFLKIAVQEMAHKRAGNWDETYAFFLVLEGKAKNYRSVVGEPLGHELMSTVMWQVMDNATEDALNKFDSERQFDDLKSMKTWSQLKVWIDERYERSVSRMVPSRSKPTSNTRMDTSAMGTPGAEP